jgi:16S rRNA (guanine527-N7)-methyltransferase
MKIGDEAWSELIISGARELGVAVNRDQTTQFVQYGRELLRWNRKTNLTAITKPREVALKHFVDSLAPVPVIPLNAAVLDIGCGAGLPGIPLRILRPDLDMTLIDGVRKKISFVKTMIHTLNLERIKALNARAEQLSQKADQSQRYQVVVCRALADAAKAVSWGLPFLAPGGMIMLLKGVLAEKESKPLKALVDKKKLALEVKEYQLPHTTFKRVLIKVSR